MLIIDIVVCPEQRWQWPWGGTWLQSKGKDEPETLLNAHQQKEHPDATEGKDIADNNPDIDYEGLESEVEPVTQEHKEVDPDAEYAKM